MVPADSGKVPRASPYSGAASGSAADFAYRAFTCYGLAFQPVLLSCGSPLLAVLQPRHNAGLGFSPFARHYSGNRCFFLFLWVLRCFSSPRSLRLLSVTGLQPDGLPHSDTTGSMPPCGSPVIFAAWRVLLRPPKPRHPPFALLLFALVIL